MKIDVVLLLVGLLMMAPPFAISNEDNSVLSLTVDTESYRYIHPEHPQIADWYHSCENVQDLRDHEADWGFCTGYIFAVIQSIYATTNKRCANFTVRNIMDSVESNAAHYKELHSPPTKGDKNGKTNLSGENMYMPTAWQRPAFQVLKETLEKICQ